MWMVLKEKFFLLIYKNAIKRLKGKGLRKYPLMKGLKNYVREQAKSDFAEVNGHKMYLGAKDSMKLSVNGVYEKLETDWVEKTIQKGDIILDVGANIGYYTLTFAKLVGNTGKVFSFEPELLNFNLLQKNIDINNYKNVVTENVALSNIVGTTKLYLSNIQSGMHRIYPSQFCSDDFVEAKTTSLDEYFKDDELGDKISFIKIDVEGSELGVLKGMKNIFQRNKKLKILMEFVPSCIKESGAQPEELIKILQDQGFNFRHTDDDSETIKSVKNIENFLQKFDGDKTDFHPKGTNLICERE